MLWHVVLISFRTDVPKSAKDFVFKRYQTLDKDCGGREAGILFWRVGHNIDLRKNVHLVEIAIFKDWKARETFRAHPKHVELTNVLRGVADWQLGNINLDINDIASLAEIYHDSVSWGE